MQKQKSSQSPIATPASTHKWFLFLLVVSVLTMATHIYLTNQHYGLKLGTASGPAICNISATFNCDSVATSRYANLFGIPIALLGLLAQIAFFILLIAARYELSQSSAWIRRMLLWFSFFTVVVSLIMGGISSLLLGTYCLFCMAVYALSVLQLFGSWKFQLEKPMLHLKSDFSHFLMQTRWVLILIILIPALGWLINSMTLKNAGFDKIDLIVQDSVNEWEAIQPAQFQLDRGLVQGGGNNPVMTIVEFADFLCPHCKMASMPLESFTQSHPDVKLVFKLFTLDGTCNKAIPNRGDGARCKLGAAVMCAEQTAQKGWKAHHWVFERQDDFLRLSDAKPVIEKMSQELGLTADAMENCMNADSTREYLIAMAQEGATARIQGTPTIFVNGKLLPRGQVIPVLEAVYQKLKK